MKNPQSVGLFGGTFDPVHIGHLRTAMELRDLLHLEEMRLVPCANPYHREATTATSDQRLAMLRLAVADNPALTVDERELHREGPSYTFDTLVEVREELGSDIPIMLCMGMDSLISLASWHNWESLVELAHIVAACRPGFELSAKGAVTELVKQRQVESIRLLHEQPCGGILIKTMTLLPISATELREAVREGHSLKYLVPDSIAAYIREQGLYRNPTTH